MIFSHLLYKSPSYLLSLGGSDFQQISRTYSFPTRNNTACTTIEVVDDRLALEGAEQFIVELTLPPGQSALQLGTNRQIIITIIDNDGKVTALLHPAACSIQSSPFDSLVVVSVEFANRSIEVSEAVGEVTVCLLKNSTTAMDFNVTVASLESSPVSAEGM